MAYTASQLVNTVMGNMRVISTRYTADAATQAIDSGLGKIFTASYIPQSMTAIAQLRINELSTGTAGAGYIAVSGLTSGDEFIVTYFGV